MSEFVLRVWAAADRWVRERLEQAETAQGLVEYALIIALVAIVLILALSGLAQSINNVFNAIGSKLANLPGGP
jgi:pilus assembly protein Flp/PilA